MQNPSKGPQARGCNLTLDEIREGAWMGVRRRLESIRLVHSDRFGSEHRAWQSNLVGALCELAVCKAMDVPWPKSINNFHGPDAEDDWQIRGRTEPNACMIVRPEDSGDDLYISVSGLRFAYTVWGWQFGHVLQKVPLTDPGGRGAPCHEIPNELLEPMSTIFDVVESKTA